MRDACRAKRTFPALTAGAGRFATALAGRLFPALRRRAAGGSAFPGATDVPARPARPGPSLPRPEDGPARPRRSGRARTAAGALATVALALACLFGGAPDAGAQAPTISSVAITSDANEDGREGNDATYAIGDEIEATVTFSASVTVTGSPQLTLDVGGTSKTAAYDSADSTGATLVFTYTVAEGDADTDGIAVGANQLALNGGTIKAGTADAALDHGALAAQSGHKVDGVRPTITAAETSTDGTSVTVTFSEAISEASANGFRLSLSSGVDPATVATVSGTTVVLTSFTSSPLPLGDDLRMDLTNNAVRDAAGNSNAGGSLTVTNNVLGPTPPTVANAIPDQRATVGAAFSYTVPADTFTDANGDTLSYAATRGDDTPLPVWLGFNTVTRTFSGTPGEADTGTLTVKVTASDGTATASDSFDIRVGATDVCDRTAAVRDAIVAAVSGVDDCGVLTPAHLAGIAGRLDLQSKSLASLRAGDFDGLTGVTQLFLTTNSLTSLPANIFDGLTALTTLDLGFNSLASLPANIFDRLTALRTLRLNDNNLALLPDDIFDRLTALTALRLDGNSGAPFRPVANAGPDRTGIPSMTVSLSGAATGAWGDNVTWEWIQVDGASSDTQVTGGVTLMTDADTGTAMFTAPASDTTLYFRLVVTPRGGAESARGTAVSAADRTTVTVSASATGISSVAITSDPNDDDRAGDDGTYAIGDEIAATVTFSGNVTVTGTPQLTLDVGGVSKTAAYDSADSTATALVFTYTVAEGDADSDGIAIGGNRLALNGGTITAGTADAALGHNALAAQSGHKVDGVRPTITAAETSPDGTSITVTFSEAIGTADASSFNLILPAGGDNPTVATVNGASVVLTSLLFGPLPHGDDVRMDVTRNAVRDAAGNGNANAARITVTNYVELPAHAVASVAITSDPGDDENYATGDAVEVTVTFGAAMTVGTTGGTPRIRISLTASTEGNRWADYARGSGTTALVFRYTVAAGDESVVGGIFIPVNTLELNGGTIRDASGTDALLDHAAVSRDAGHRVNFAAPSFVSAEITTDGASILLIYSEDLAEQDATTAAPFSLKVDGAAVALHGLNASTISGTVVTLRPLVAVSEGQTVTLSYTDAGEFLKDLAGNPAAALTDQAVTNNTGRTGIANVSIAALNPGGDAVARVDHVRFEVTRTGPTLAALAVTVQLTQDQAFLPDSLLSRTVTIPAGHSSAELRVPAGQFRDVAVSGTLTATLDTAEGYVPSNQDSASVDIRVAGEAIYRDRPVWVMMTEYGYDVDEGDGVLEVEILAARSPGLPRLDSPVYILFYTASVPEEAAPPALYGSDYEPRTLLVEFKPEEFGHGRWNQFSLATKRIRIPIVDDEVGEPVEQFLVLLDRDSRTMPGVVLSYTSEDICRECRHPVLIHDDDPPKAVFRSMPPRHYSPFDFEVVFSEPIAIARAAMIEHVFEVTNGRVTEAVRLDNEHDEAEGVLPNREWRITVDSFSDAAVTVVLPETTDCAAAGAVCTADGRMLSAEVRAVVPGPSGQPALTAAFHDLPESHGGDAFTFEVHYSEPFKLLWRTMLESALRVENGHVTGARRLDNPHNERPLVANRSWRVTVRPDAGAGDVTVTLPATTDCAATGAVCNGEEKLSAAVTATVPRVPAVTAPSRPPLTARFANGPPEHDGETAFTFEVHYSEPFPLRWRTMLETALRVTNGRVTGARRLDNPHNERPLVANRSWRVTVQPSGTGDVTVILPRTADCSASGAVCTGDGRMLSHPTLLRVMGPPSLGVADASVTEAEGATLDFAVTMSRAAPETVTVDWTTSDGSATAGSDYTADSGTLTFKAGQTSKTVSVSVLDDAVNEGAETMTLTLSNVSGGNVWLSDATATGTIENNDPLQKMWLSRFGRTVADHVTAAVSDRLANPLAGAQLTVGGQSVDLEETDDEAFLGQAMTSVARALGAPNGPAPEGDPGSGGWPGTGIGGSSGAGSAAARDVSGRELLLGSAFHLAAEGDGAGPGLAAWGRVAAGGFDGEHADDTGRLRVDGEVVTGILGVDAEWRRLLAGVAVSVSEGEGSFVQPGVDEGTIESTMTVVSPYARYMVTDRVSVWGLAGWGTGAMTIVQAANDRGQPERVSRTDLSMRLAAMGGRGALMQANETGGIDLALKADAFWVETESEAVSNEGNTTASASRVRLALEGGRAFEIGGGAALRPSLELGLRHDGGDAETGTGVELGAGVSYQDPSSGLTVEAKARMLVAHADSDYEEWGVSGAVRLAPGGRGRGLSFSLSPTLGAASSAAERLWGARDAGGLAPDGEFEAARGLQGELGYGLSLFGDRFTGTPNVGFGLSDTARDWRIGWRLTSAVAGDPGFEVKLDATRREAANGNEPPEHGVMLRGAIRW